MGEKYAYTEPLTKIIICYVTRPIIYVCLLMLLVSFGVIYHYVIYILASYWFFQLNALPSEPRLPKPRHL